jgi:hypothetical protein
VVVAAVRHHLDASLLSVEEGLEEEMESEKSRLCE